MVVLLLLALNAWSGYKVGTYGDDGSYVSVTDSLVRHVPYGTLLTPNEDQYTQFPFVFPLLLAPVRAAFPGSLDALRVVPLLATLLAMSVLFWGWRLIGKGLDYWYGLAVVALTAFSPLTILHARTVMSEGVLLLFTLLMIVWVERVVERQPRGWGILLGVLAVTVVYARTVGAFFVAVWVLYLIYHLRGAVWKQLGVGALTAGLLLALIVITTTVRPADLLPQEYLNQFRQAVNSGTPAPNPAFVVNTPYDRQLEQGVLKHLDIADKLPYQMEIPLTQWTDEHGLTWLRYLPALILLGLLVVGAVEWVRRTGITAFQIMVPPYVALLFFWVWIGPRLIYPIQPQLALTALLGIAAIARRASMRLPGALPPRRVVAWTVGLVTLALCLVLIPFDLRFQSAMLLPGDPEAREAILATYVPQDATVLSTHATTEYLYSPNPYIDIPPRVSSTADLVAYLRRQHIEYIVSNDGVETSEQNQHLRIGAVSRFVSALAPLVGTPTLTVLYEQPADDLVIYRVNQAALADLP